MAPMTEYYLIQEEFVTAGAVRSLGDGSDGTVLCGSQANSPNLRRFRISSQSVESLPSFEEVGEAIVHDHWVTVVTSLGPRIIQTYADGVFVTGCHDSNIRVYHPQTEEQLLKLEGHTKGVISFSWTSLNKLVSGSWDGSARIWDLELGGACLMELLGHENGVSVLGLNSGTILTASTGENVNGKPANFALRVWDAATGTQQGKAIEHHDGSIRDICAVRGLNQGFATTSNDGSIRVYTVDEQSPGTPMHVADGSSDGGGCTQPSDILPGAVFYHPVASDNSPTFVLCATCLTGSHANGGAGGGVSDIVSCDMDGVVMVSDPLTGERKQVIEHPNTVWAVMAVPGTDGDFITGCQDGAMRLFSKNLVLTQTGACQTLHANFSEAVQETKAKNRSGPSAEEISKHPSWADRGAMSKSEGTVMVFNKDGKAIAAQYTSGNWIELGEVTGSAGGSSSDSGEVNGVTYDHVMPVEMEGPGGAVVTYRMGFNDTENPFIASQRFLDQNGLDQSFHRQVADWIMERGGGRAAPTIGDVANGGAPSSSGAGVGDASMAPPAPPPPGYSFPLRGYLGHGEVPPVEKLLAKINDLNSGQESTVQLSGAQMSDAEALLQTLKATSMYHSSTITPAQLRVLVHICDKWAIKDAYPGFDLLRLVCLHPGGAAVLASSLSSTESIIAKVLALLEGDSALNGDATKLTCLKFLNNTFKTDEMRGSLMLHGANIGTGGSALQRVLGICQAQASGAAALSKGIRSATCVLISNLIVASFASPEARSLLFNSPEYLQAVMHTSYAALSQEPAEDGKGSAENIFLLLNGIGTLATHQQLGADLVAKVKTSNISTNNAPVGDILAIVEASWGTKMSQPARQGLDEVKALFQ